MQTLEEYTQKRIEIAQLDIVKVYWAENDVAIAIYADSLMETTRYDYYVIRNYNQAPEVITYNWFDNVSNMDSIIRESLAPDLFLYGAIPGTNELEEKIFRGDAPITEIYDKESLAKVLSLVSDPNAINCVVTRLGVLCEGYKDKMLFDYVCKTNNYKNLDYICKN